MQTQAENVTHRPKKNQHAKSSSRMRQDVLQSRTNAASTHTGKKYYKRRHDSTEKEALESSQKDPRPNLEEKFRLALQQKQHSQLKAKFDRRSAPTVKTGSIAPPVGGGLNDPAILSLGPVSRSPVKNFQSRIPVASPTKKHATNYVSDRDDLGELVAIITAWHGKDRGKVEKLLDALKRYDKGDSSAAKSSQSVGKAQRTVPASTGKLDPEAAPFQGHSQHSTSARPGRMPRLPSQVIHNPRIRPRVDIFPQHMVMLPFTPVPLVPEPVYINHWQPSPSEIRPIPPPAPYYLGPHSTTIFDDDDETGRTAKVQVPALGERNLLRFKTKFPMTGLVKAPEDPPIEQKHAAAIQQRLEYLIMKKKEQEAWERKMANSRRGVQPEGRTEKAAEVVTEGTE